MDNRLLSRTDWDADTYLEAALRGDFGDTRVELIDGEVHEVASMGHPHWLSETVIRTSLTRTLNPAHWTVGGQSTVKLSPRDLPEPDVYVLRGPIRGFTDLATAADVMLMVEVGDSSRVYDRKVKLPRYALAGVPEVWLVDLVDGVVEKCLKPVGRDYLQRVRLTPGETVTLAVDGTDLATLDVAELFP